MPISNGTGTFSVGRDCTLVIMAAGGVPLEIPNVTGFSAKQETANVKVDRLDGVQMNAELPKGWTGSFDAERGSSAVDDFFAAGEAAWYAGGTYNVSTVYQYVVESNGSTSVYQFDNVALKLDDAGEWKGDASVKQKISFVANRRRRV